MSGKKNTLVVKGPLKCEFLTVIFSMADILDCRGDIVKSKICCGDLSVEVSDKEDGFWIAT